MHPPTLIESIVDYKDWLLETKPKQGTWTEEEYLWLTDDTSRLIEFTDGVVEPLPMPTEYHQAIVKFLLYAFDAIVIPRKGKVFFSPLRLRVRPGKFREPDILLVQDAKDPRTMNQYWTGADLVVEVVSEDKPERDLVEKRHDYAEGNVPEYWIVNPLDETITVLRLDAGTYGEHGIYRRGDTATAATLTGFAVAVSAVFDAE